MQKQKQPRDGRATREEGPGSLNDLVEQRGYACLDCFPCISSFLCLSYYCSGLLIHTGKLTNSHISHLAIAGAVSEEKLRTLPLTTYLVSG